MEITEKKQEKQKESAREQKKIESKEIKISKESLQDKFTLISNVPMTNQKNEEIENTNKKASEPDSGKPTEQISLEKKEEPKTTQKSTKVTKVAKILFNLAGNCLLYFR